MPWIILKNPALETDPARSAQMALVRGRDTKPEMRVRRFLHAEGFRFRLHDRRLPGTPDLVFPSRRLAVHVHGCFWHQHPGCPAARTPKSRLDFWQHKLAGNVARDARTGNELRALGWDFIVVWECETKSLVRLKQLAEEIRTHAEIAKKAGTTLRMLDWSDEAN